MTDQETEGVSPIFSTDVKIPKMTVTDAEANCWDDIHTARNIPRGDKPVIVPLVRVINGVVQNVIMKIIPTPTLLQEKNLFKWEMKKVFTNATSEWMTFVENFREFYFREGSLKSNWVAASKLSLKFYKTYGKERADRVEMNTAEKEAIGATDFLLRIVLTPEKDPKTFCINWVALPVPEPEFKKVTQYKEARNGSGYPVLSVCAQIVEIGLKPAKTTGKFGLPGVPVLIRDDVDDVDPSDFDVIHAVRLVVAEAEQLNIVPPATWALMNGNGEMIVTPARHEHAWPRLPEPATEPTVEEKEGEFL